MASLLQVLETLAQNLETPIYPNGLLNPSIVGVQVTIESGWPIRSQLDRDLEDGKVHVSVYPTNNERVVTKFQRNFESLTLTDPTITLTVENNTVTVGGTVVIPQAVMLIVNGTGYGYQIQSSDTLQTIATNTAALIPGATATGTVITIPSAYDIVARLATPYTASQELSRSDRVFMITCWCPNPTIRATLESAIDIYMKQNYRIVLPDNYFAQVFYQGIKWTDMLEQSLIYRSDLSYTVQYATTVTNDYTSIADPFVNSIALNF